MKTKPINSHNHTLERNSQGNQQLNPKRFIKSVEKNSADISINSQIEELKKGCGNFYFDNEKHKKMNIPTKCSGDCPICKSKLITGDRE